MKKFLFLIMTLGYILPVFANKNACSLTIPGYKIAKHSIYPFSVGKKDACFFAFFVKNPDLPGNGNFYSTLWYGYYKKDEPTKIYEFPKPSDKYWGSVCHINAISFHDMNADNIRDVTVIGSCDKANEVKYRFPFVFILQDGKYVLNEDVYSNLYGFINLTVADIHAYLNNPQKYYKILRARYKLKHLPT